MTGDQVQRGKPHPDIFLNAYSLIRRDFSETSTPPTLEKTTVIEDSPSGVAGGLAAGMNCIWMPDQRIVGSVEEYL